MTALPANFYAALLKYFGSNSGLKRSGFVLSTLTSIDSATDMVRSLALLLFKPSFKLIELRIECFSECLSELCISVDLYLFDGYEFCS